jgi:hypothetical protein
MYLAERRSYNHYYNAACSFCFSFSLWFSSRTFKYLSSHSLFMLPPRCWEGLAEQQHFVLPPARRDRVRRAQRVPSALCSCPPQQRCWRAAPNGGTERRRRSHVLVLMGLRKGQDVAFTELMNFLWLSHS